MSEATNKRERQKELERKMAGLGVERYQKQLQAIREGKRAECDLKPGQKLLIENIEKVADAIEKIVNKPPNGWASRNKFLTEYIEKCTGLEFRPFEVAFIVSRVCINAMSFSLPVVKASEQIANLLEDLRNFRLFEEDDERGRLYRKTEKKLQSCSNYKRKRILIKGLAKLVECTQEDWKLKDKIALGNLLLRIFVETTDLLYIKTIQTREEIVNSSGTRVRKLSTILLQTEKGQAFLEQNHEIHKLLTPFFMPMIVPPKDWDSPFNGGYLTPFRRDIPLVKTWSRGYLDELANESMPTVYNSINVIQSTPWKINVKIYEVMTHVWEQGGGIHWGLPSRELEGLPQCSICEGTPEPQKGKPHPCFEIDREAHKEWKQKAARVYDRWNRAKSKIVALNYKLQIAKWFKDEEEIFFPHTMDWRGRIYPLPSFLNPQGDDTAKALLTFAHCKEVDEKAMEWLKIHGANCYGEDKLPLADRVAWVDDHETQILACAENPYDNRFWTEADKPWMFLAFCFEYIQARETGYSSLPISMDASCSGLQHFSAMLLDPVGGLATNLRFDGGKRQDIYEQVAEVVKRKVYEDAWTGKGQEPLWVSVPNGPTKEDMARAWDGYIDRQIVKRPVMTMPYGSTKYGMRDQIEAELIKEEQEKGKVRIDNQDKVPYCYYLSEICYEAIREVVIAARKAMDKLHEMAKEIAQHDLPITWKTPSGFVVVQDYKRSSSIRVDLVVGGCRWVPSVRVNRDSIDSRKQASGISPNFVHSLDASHLMLCVQKCLDEGIEYFGMVHDSFATHAADAAALARIVRETFIEMYSVDRFEEFRTQLIRQTGLGLPEAPAKGDDEGNLLNLADVSNSPYFFA